MRTTLLFICLTLFATSANPTVHVKSETFLTSDNVTLHYFDAGSDQSPAIVLIPGWTMPAEIFEPQINDLSGHFRVIALDPRSQGDSQKTPEGNYPTRHARDIDELFQHLHLTSVVLLGWSNGVPDVLTYVDKAGTAKLRGVILVDGFLDFSAPQMQKGLAGMLNAFQIDRPKFTDAFVRGMYATKQTDEYIQHVKEASLKTPTNTAAVEMFNVLSLGDVTPILAKLDKPVLYIYEPQLESQAKLIQSKLPSARAEVFKAGHAMFVDDPEHFNKVVAEFINSLPPSTNQSN
jgi:non-heme chloroperoxidase